MTVKIVNSRLFLNLQEEKLVTNCQFVSFQEGGCCETNPQKKWNQSLEKESSYVMAPIQQTDRDWYFVLLVKVQV